MDCAEPNDARSDIYLSSMPAHLITSRQPQENRSANHDEAAQMPTGWCERLTITSLGKER